MSSLPMTFTPAAIAHLQRQMAKQPAKVMRFFIKKAGCSGLQYQLLLADGAEPDDVAYKINAQLTIHVDTKSIPFIQGTEVDYIKKGLQGYFEYRNPLQKGSCGCGESFTV